MEGRTLGDTAEQRVTAEPGVACETGDTKWCCSTRFSSTGDKGQKPKPKQYINNVEILFKEKRLARAGLQAAHAYLGLWEMFGPARGFVAARRASLGKISKY